MKDGQVEMDQVNYIRKTNEWTPASTTENKEVEAFFKTTKRKGNCWILKE